MGPLYTLFGEYSIFLLWGGWTPKVLLESLQNVHVNAQRTRGRSRLPQKSDGILEQVAQNFFIDIFVQDGIFEHCRQDK